MVLSRGKHYGLLYKKGGRFNFPTPTPSIQLTVYIGGSKSHISPDFDFLAAQSTSDNLGTIDWQALACRLRETGVSGKSIVKTYVWK